MNNTIVVGMFAVALYSMVVIMYYQHKYEKAKAYETYWIELCDKLISQANTDGWCRLLMTREDVLEMKSYFKSDE